MAINVSQAFKRTSKNPIDETFALTKAQMLTVNDNLMPDYYFTVCQDDGCFYLYDKTATASLTTGKFTKFDGGTDSLAFGYLNETNGKFYKESTYTTEIAGNTGKLYITLDTNYIYRYDATNGFVQVGGGSTGGSVEGYLNPTNGKFYEDSTYTTEISGEAGKLYVTLDTNKVYRYDSTNGFVLVGGEVETIQYDTMPTASSALVGTIVQYVGSTTATYTKGYWYECVLDGATYKWQNIPVQEGGSGHTIIDGAGQEMNARDGLQFIGATVTDDSANNVTIVEVDGVQKNTLPTASADNLGKVYQFLGTTGTYKHGRFYECVTDGTSYSWEEVEVSEDTVIQFAALPVASVDYLGAIYQYTGATSGSLTNGYFYECVLDGSTYKWTEKRVESPEVETISKADFDALTPAERNNGKAYFIPDADILTNFTVMGNRFDKANIYTTDERMIGSWMGKPLYQKTFEFGSLPDTTTKTVTIPITNLGRIIDYKVSATDGVRTLPIPYVSDGSMDVQLFFTGTEVRIITASNRTTYSAIVTLQYTKTSDATVSIGTGNDYSTDEQIIGTWIDGKPIYQKTIEISPETVWGAGGFREYKVADNIEAMIFDEIHVYNSSEQVWYMTGSYLFRKLNTETGKYQINNTSQSGLTWSVGYATIQYTKTTD